MKGSLRVGLLIERDCSNKLKETSLEEWLKAIKNYNEAVDAMLEAKDKCDLASQAYHDMMELYKKDRDNLNNEFFWKTLIFSIVGSVSLTLFFRIFEL